MKLINTTDTLECILGEAATTTEPTYYTESVTVNATSIEYVSHTQTKGALNGTTAVTIVAAPGSGNEVECIRATITNIDTVTHTVTIRINANGTFYNIVYKQSLTAGQSLEYSVTRGFILSSQSGGGGGSLPDPVTVAHGGTGQTSLTAHGVLIGEGTSNVAITSAGTSGQLLIGQGATSDPSFQTMGTDATINASGALTIANNAITTAKINNSAVTYAKLQNETASSILGNPTGSSAVVSEITLGSGLSFSGTTLVATGSGGTVTSVGISGPSIITWSGTPVTSSGTLTGVLASQSANTVLAGPTSGSAAAPTFRALVAADLPAVTAYYGNLAINGNFQFWQEKGPSPAAFIGSTNDLYFADGWKANNVAKSGANWQPARASTNVHFAPTMLTLKNTSVSADKIAVWQPMESWISQQLSNGGYAVTISFWAMISSGTPTLNVGLLEWAGSADSLGGNSSGNLYSAWSTTTGTDPTWSASYALKGKTSTAFSASSTWQQFTATITVDPSQSNLLPIVWLDSAVAQNVILRIAEFQVVPQSPVVIDDPSLLSVFRFYAKSFLLDTAVAQNAGTSGALEGQNVNTIIEVPVRFEVDMRASPTITTYCPNALNANWSTNGGTPTASAQQGNPKGFSAQGTGSSDTNAHLLQWSADARL